MVNFLDCTEKEKAVWEVQTWLRAAARGGMPLKMLVPDGIYGDETRETVRLFQGLVGIPQTGTVDYVTWQAIKNAYEEALEKCARPEKIAPFSSFGVFRPVCPGESGPSVYIIQAMIEELRREYDGLVSEEISGVLDGGTVENVKKLQSVWGCEITGRVDLKTWNMLAAAYNALPCNDG